MRPKILTVGRIEVEIDMTFPAFPSAGRTVKGKDLSRFPGGSGINSAIALNRICADAVLAGRVGSDPGGKRLVNFLASQKVDTRYILQDPILPTGNYVRMTEDGPNGRVNSRGIRFEGAGGKLSAEDMDFAFKSYPMGAIVNADIPDEALLAAVFYGAKNDVPLLLDATAKRETPLPVKELKHFEIFFADGDTAARMTSVEPTSLEKSLKCCIALAGMLEARYYVLNLAERGNFIYDGMYHRVVPAYDVEDHGCVASHHYFVAAMFAKYLVSGDIKAAVELGAVAEAAAKQRTGSATSLPTDQELKKFIREKTETT